MTIVNYTQAAAHRACQDNVPAEAIWPKTNAVVIQYKLPDLIIPHIHNTVWTIRSSEWQHKFQRPEWSLNQEQALSLMKVLLADLGTEVPKVTKHTKLCLQPLLMLLPDPGAICNMQA